MIRLLLVVLSTCLASSIALASDDFPSAVVVAKLPADTPTRPVKLSKVVVDLNRGQPIGTIRHALLCVGGEPLVWKGGRVSVDPEDFNAVFKEELEKIGFDVIAESTNLFDDGRDKRAEFYVGGRIRSIVVEACLPRSGFGDVYTARGSARMEVEWQVFDRLDRRIVDQYTTRTGVRKAQATSGGIDGLLFAAFGENVRALAASGKLQRILVGPPAELDVAHTPRRNLTPLAVAAPPRGRMAIDDAVGATVLIQSGEGHGSGFLFSPDGYFLTNHHVVGTAKFVKVIWSDKLESLGEVVRSDRGRDIALIKADSRSRRPLAIRAAPTRVSEEVYAIGAPLEEKLQNTVTRGIVSANRVLDGYTFVQSDVSVVPGNSGGPLVDKEGQLIGVADLGFRINEASQGVNLFIPAREALDFLGVTVR